MNREFKKKKKSRRKTFTYKRKKGKGIKSQGQIETKYIAINSE